MKGTIHGLGLGPGNPDLMSVRADRLVRNAANIAYFRKAGRKGHARAIVEGMFPSTARELPMEYPVTTEIPLSDPRYNEVLSQFYAECMDHLEALVKGGEDVVVLCEGDPFFYGSFMHVYERLKDKIPVQVVPAITGMSAAWTASGAPITWGDDILSTVMGTLDEQTLTKAIGDADALVIMKIGRNLPKVRRALDAAGKADRAVLIEYASMEGETVRPLSKCSEEKLPYFSIIVVHGQGRRP